MKDRPEGLAVGRIVHYIASPDGQCTPAIIMTLGQGSAVNLRVFGYGPPSVDSWFQGVPFDDSAEPRAHTWHWPERV